MPRPSEANFRTLHKTKHSAILFDPATNRVLFRARSTSRNQTTIRTIDHVTPADIATHLDEWIDWL